MADRIDVSSSVGGDGLHNRVSGRQRTRPPPIALPKSQCQPMLEDFRTPGSELHTRNSLTQAFPALDQTPPNLTQATTRHVLTLVLPSSGASLAGVAIHRVLHRPQEGNIYGPCRHWGRFFAGLALITAATDTASVRNALPSTSYFSAPLRVH
jgi:hypothetical protein